MRNAKAFVFAAEEDFGITPVEAQSCGTPIIAFGKGGSLETVRPFGVDNPTGILFDKQDIDSVIDAVQKFETMQDQILPNDCRAHALKFSTERFNQEISEYVNSKYFEFVENKKSSINK